MKNRLARLDGNVDHYEICLICEAAYEYRDGCAALIAFYIAAYAAPNR